MYVCVCVCVCVFEYHLSIKHPTICYNMDGPQRHYAKRKKSEKDKYCALFAESKKNKNTRNTTQKKRSDLWSPEAEGWERENWRRWSKDTNLQL